MSRDRLPYAPPRVARPRRAHRRRDAQRIAAGAHVGALTRQHPEAHGVVVDRVNEQLTRREALVAALRRDGARWRGAGAPRGCACGRDGDRQHRRHPARSRKPGDHGGRQQRAQGGASSGPHGSTAAAASTASASPSRSTTTSATPQRGASAVVHAITKDHCSLILGGWDSKVALAEIEEAHRLATPFFVSYAWSPDDHEARLPRGRAHRAEQRHAHERVRAVHVKRGYTRVALIAEDTAYGQGLGETIRASATLAGIDIAAEAFKRDTHDLRPILKRLIARKPQALLIAAVVVPGRTLAITQARAARVQGRHRARLGLRRRGVLEGHGQARRRRHLADVLGPDAAPHGRRARRSSALYTKRYKHAPLIYQAFTWDQLNAWKWAVDTAGSVAPADVVPVLPRIDMQGTMGHITLSNQPKTVHFNQWEGVTVYFDQAPKQGATDADRQGAVRASRATRSVGAGPSDPGHAASLALARRGARARRGRRPAARGRRARRRRDHGRRLRRALDGDPDQAARALLRRRRARAGHLRRRRERPQRRLRALLVGQARHARRAVRRATARSRSRTPPRRPSTRSAAFCDEHGIDAHFHRGGHLWTATTPAQLGAWDGVMATCRELGVMPFEEWTPEETARAQRLGSPHRGHVRAVGRDRAAGAARARAAPRRARARRAHPRGHARHAPRPPRAGRAAHAARRRSPPTASSIATNAWAVGMRELHTRLAVISSDIVATAPMPERLREIGWTRHECISDSRAADLLLPHDRRRAHRLRQGRLGHRAERPHRPALRPRREARARRRPRACTRSIRCSRTCRSRPTGAARSTARAPASRSSATSAAAATSSTASASRATAWGRASSAARSSPSLALGIADEWSGCGLVDGLQGRFPPDPVRFLGAHVVREGVARKEAAEMDGREPSRLAVALARLAPAGMIPKKGE